MVKAAKTQTGSILQIHFVSATSPCRERLERSSGPIEKAQISFGEFLMEEFSTKWAVKIERIDETSNLPSTTVGHIERPELTCPSRRTLEKMRLTRADPKRLSPDDLIEVFVDGRKVGQARRRQLPKNKDRHVLFGDNDTSSPSEMRTSARYSKVTFGPGDGATGKFDVQLHRLWRCSRADMGL